MTIRQSEQFYLKKIAGQKKSNKREEKFKSHENNSLKNTAI